MAKKKETDATKYGGYKFTVEGKLNVELLFTTMAKLYGEETGIPGEAQNIRLKDDPNDTRLFAGMC